MLKDISARLNVVDNTTQDVSARLNVVETKVGACGVSSGGGAPGAATSMSAATLEQMRAMLRQQGSGSGAGFSVCTCTPLMAVKANAAPHRCALLSVPSSALSQFFAQNWSLNLFNFARAKAALTLTMRPHR